jgi:hypothetical protein
VRTNSHHKTVKKAMYNQNQSRDSYKAIPNSPSYVHPIRDLGVQSKNHPNQPPIQNPHCANMKIKIIKLVQFHRLSIDIMQALPFALIVAHRSLLVLDLGLELVQSALLCGSFSVEMLDRLKANERLGRTHLVLSVQRYNTRLVCTHDRLTSADHAWGRFYLKLVGDK